MAKASWASTRRVAFISTILTLVGLAAFLTTFDGPGMAGSTRRGPGEAQLISIQPLPAEEGVMCEWPPEGTLMAALQQVLRDQSGLRTETARLLFTQELVYVVAGKTLKLHPEL